MTIRRMCIACCIPKSTNTHSEYVILIAFPVQQWLDESMSMLLYLTLPVMFWLTLKFLHPFCNDVTDKSSATPIAYLYIPGKLDFCQSDSLLQFYSRCVAIKQTLHTSSTAQGKQTWVKKKESMLGINVNVAQARKKNLSIFALNWTT